MPREVVSRDELVAVIDDFLEPFKRRSQETGEEGVKDIPQAAAERLALRTGRTPETVARTIYRIKKETSSGFVLFTTADWLVTIGMGRPDLFHTDLKVVFENRQCYGLVSYSRVSFAMEELCEKLGPEATAQLIGVSKRTICDWRNQRFAQIRKGHAARILQSLWAVRSGNGFNET